jgi:hypothetical protein
MYFDGVDDYVQTPFIPVFNQQPFTVVAWASYLSVKSNNPIFATGDAETTDRYLSVYISYGWPVLSFYADDVGGRTYLPVGAFNHLVFMWEGPPTNLQKLYVNSVLDKTRVSTGLLTVTSGSATNYGGWVGRAFRAYLHGYIAHILVYSRALSDSEIQWNYLYPDNPVRNGLVLWLKADPAYVRDIDGDGVLEWIDLSGYGNHGKIYGATLVKLIRDPVR